MADRQRGGIELMYQHGFFHDVSEREPLQLYQVIEREQESGTFAFPACLRSDTSVLLYCSSGDGSLQMDEKELPFSSGEVVWLDSTQHTVKAISSSQRLRYTCLHLSFFSCTEEHALSPLYSFFKTGDFHTASTTDVLSFLFTSLVAELCMPQPFPVAVRGVLNQILVTTYRSIVRRKPTQTAPEPTVNAVGHTAYAIIRYVDEHLYSMNSLMDMAKDLGYSYNYLSHLFRRKTGMTIQSYVSRKKIEKSLELLESTTLSVTEIASALNYDCIQSFSKAFKRAQNMSPTEYRTAYLGSSQKNDNDTI